MYSYSQTEKQLWTETLPSYICRLYVTITTSTNLVATAGYLLKSTSCFVLLLPHYITHLALMLQVQWKSWQGQGVWYKEGNCVRSCYGICYVHRFLVLCTRLLVWFSYRSWSSIYTAWSTYGFHCWENAYCKWNFCVCTTNYGPILIFFIYGYYTLSLLQEIFTSKQQ